MAETRKNGQVGIVDGKFIVVNPQDGGRYAVLYPPEEGVRILINGEEIETGTRVGEEDIIEAVPLTLMEEARMECKVSPDGLYAEIAVHPRIISQFYLKETEMKTSLKPGVEKREHREKVLTVLDAELELKNNNIVYGVDTVALKEAVENAEGEFKTIAWGKEVQEGKDGWIEFLINPEIEMISYGEEEQKVDYRERFRFPTVKKGDVIALIHPPVEGIPGQKVTGEIIHPRPVKSTRIGYGEGVDPGESESEIVALRDGRLVVNGNHIKVVNLLVHNGDVDLESGNIRFNGDVRIYGNIQEGMLVEAQGDLFVEGNGYGAVIKAGGEIHFTKNIIKCQVEGGLYFALLKKLLPVLDKLGDQFGGVMNNIKEVVSGLSRRGQKVDEKTLILITRSVVEKVSPLIQESITTLEQLLSHHEDPRLNPLRELLSFLKLICFSPAKIDAAEDLARVEKTLAPILNKFKRQLQDIPVFSASYIQNSDIRHGGEIKVVGAGSYLSKLKAGEGVNVQGVFRGGSIEAQGDVRVKEFVYIAAAAEHLAKKPTIRIKVPAHCSIFFHKVHVDTTVQVGKFVYRFDKGYERIKVGYDSESGMLQITSF